MKGINGWNPRWGLGPVVFPHNQLDTPVVEYSNSFFDPTDPDYYGNAGNVEEEDLVYVQSPYWDSRYLGVGPALPPEYQPKVEVRPVHLFRKQATKELQDHETKAHRNYVDTMK